MDRIIHSKILGGLRRETVSTFQMYCSSINTPRYGSVDIVVHGENEGATDWSAAVRAAEDRLGVILKNEPRLRRQAIPEIRRLRAAYFDLKDDGEWTGTNTQLMAALLLQMLKFSPDGSVEIVYSGGEPCHCLDVLLELGPRLGIRRVGFDG